MSDRKSQAAESVLLTVTQRKSDYACQRLHGTYSGTDDPGIVERAVINQLFIQGLGGEFLGARNGHFDAVRYTD